MKRIVVAVLAVALASPLAARELPAWLAGSWRVEDGGKLTEETWLAPRDGLMIGMSRTTGGAKPWFEFVRIEQRGEQLVFIAQPGGVPPTEFVAIDGNGEALVFENTAHDFPQRVRYAPNGADRLDASIEGTVEGQSRIERWQYVRD